MSDHLLRGYLLRRLVYVVPVWLIISVFAFLLATLAPGDPAVVLLQRQGGQPPTAADVARVHKELHLDDPLPLRYSRWVAGALTGDLGRSYRTSEPVLSALAARFLATVELAVSAMVVAMLVALPVGIASAARRNSVIDHGARVLSAVAASMPSFWLGYVLIIVFAVDLRLFPALLIQPWVTTQLARAGRVQCRRGPA